MEKRRRDRAHEEERPALKAGGQLDLDVEGLDEEGRGVARFEGKTVLVTGALPAEKVRARIVHTGRQESFARMLRILTPSPWRAQHPACSADCDGCPLAAMEYGAQLAWKREMIAAEFGRFPSLRRLDVPLPLASPRETAYRNSAKLVVAGKHADPVIGIYRRASHDVLDTSACPIHHPLINRIVEVVKEGIRKGKVQIWDPRTERGVLRYLVVRVSVAEGTAMVVFVTGSEGGYNEIHHLAKFLAAQVPEVRVTARNANTSSGNVIFGEKGEHFLTRDHAIVEHVGEVKLLLSPRSFFQVNSDGARLLYETVREWSALSGSERVLDLYCGIGGISLFLAAHAAEVTGIEMVEEAVRDARRNARLNNRGNCRFEAGDAAELLQEMREEGGRFDVIVLNPPRRGCAETVLREAAEMAPRRMVYVSCSPQSLARDLDLLSRLGYRATRVRPVDMFPLTPHVENVVLIEKENPISADLPLSPSPWREKVAEGRMRGKARQ